MYKKIYLEITNRCNLSCDFCPHNKRELKSLSMDEFKKILKKIENHTEYLYFHVLGEPLLHEDINEFCHRRLIADYIELETGIYIPEISIGENGRLIMHNPIRYKNKLKQLIK